MPATASRACGYLRTNVLSTRSDLKKYTALRFRQEVKRHADAAGPGEDVVLVFMEVLGLEPPLTLPGSLPWLARPGGGSRGCSANSYESAEKPARCRIQPASGSKSPVSAGFCAMAGSAWRRFPGFSANS